MFDLRKGRSWEDRLFVREVTHGNKRVRLVGVDLVFRSHRSVM
jgi:hypothetical protein